MAGPLSGCSSETRALKSCVSVELEGGEVWETCELSETELGEGECIPLLAVRSCCAAAAGESDLPLPSIRPPPSCLRDAMNACRQKSKRERLENRACLQYKQVEAILQVVEGNVRTNAKT